MRNWIKDTSRGRDFVFWPHLEISICANNSKGIFPLACLWKAYNDHKYPQKTNYSLRERLARKAESSREI